ncbi:MAG TPA: acyl-CoA synthetase [Burkholderiales bacterium]|nr:acyl-CoA synthetase [Burkholderiales bacterium]
MVRPSMYDTGLAKNAANYTPLSPLSLLARTAYTYPKRAAVIYGERELTWSEVYARCRRLASALQSRGIGKNDTVAAMLPNVPAMYDAHFGVAMCGGVLNTLNTRLDAEAIGFMLDHAEAKVLLTDREYSATVRAALARAKVRPLVIDVEDPACETGSHLGEIEYEDFIAGGDPEFQWSLPQDEWDAISLNYTSGTTGNPKGVVYHHRGAYLNALSNIVSWGMPAHPVYLWTLPMFHCNGWCFTWTVAAAAGTNICLRRVDARAVLDLIRAHRVTHYCGAPIVHSMLINAPEAWKQDIDQQVSCLVAAAAPPAAIIEGMQRMGFDITHVYGLTETYGPAAVCAKHDEWRALPLEKQVELNGRQGVWYHAQERMSVIDPETMKPVPWDGETMGEVMFRGNLTMKGYLKNERATAEAFAGGWFHTGDLGVMQPDGYVKIKDRSKDVIISGGENISSLEVEDVLYRHPAVVLAAVVAKPDPRWGEVPCAFVELKEGAQATEADLIAHCRERLAHFKAPKKIVFGPLPKTSTGKIQKFILRDQVKSSAAIDT